MRAPALLVVLAVAGCYGKIVEHQQRIVAAFQAQRQGREPKDDANRLGNEALAIARGADATADRLRAGQCARDPWQSA